MTIIEIARAKEVARLQEVAAATTTMGFILAEIDTYDLAGKMIDAGIAADRKEAKRLINKTVIADGMVKIHIPDKKEFGMTTQYRLTAAGKSMKALIG
jgi:hypothetical protein